MLLADSAQTAAGKLYVLGGGWSITNPGGVASAIAIKIDVPWDRADVRHSWRLVLVDSDGRAVEGPTASGRQAVAMEGEFQVRRPPGLAPGTSIDLPLAITVPPLVLAPGARYEWRLTIDEESHEDWCLPFTTRAETPRSD